MGCTGSKSAVDEKSRDKNTIDSHSNFIRPAVHVHKDEDDNITESSIIASHPTTTTTAVNHEHHGICRLLSFCSTYIHYTNN